MIQIFYGDAGHKARCAALSAANGGANVASASGPAFDKRVMKIDTLTFWGHGDSSTFCGLNAKDFVGKDKEWKKWNPSIKTVEIITCNSRHGTELAKRVNGEIETSWVKSYTDQVTRGLKKMKLTVKALPMGMGHGSANRWSILKYSGTTATWLYITAGGAKDIDAMWPGVYKVEGDPGFTATKNYVSAGNAVKIADRSRQYTMDFGSVGQLRAALTVLA
jgi:hypothetical protein